MDDDVNLENEMDTPELYYEPTCDEKLKPLIGQTFQSEERAISFYRKYAELCGFDIRLSSVIKSRDNLVNLWRYIVCSREGKKNVAIELTGGESSENNKRRRLSQRCSCMARMVLKFNGSQGYQVKVFVSRHTHPLVGDSYKHFLKINRNIDLVYQKFFLECNRASIGPMKSFKLLKEFVGGYEHVGCSSVDFKNLSRDLRAHTCGADAQMILDTMHAKHERCSGYKFYYEVDDEDHLKNIFWAVPIAIRNYHTFGDVVSLDATYNTNRYGMRFLPFTGKDNHGKIVSFGESLIAREDIQSYSWVLERFIECMGAHPHIILSDQDPALKIVVERVLVHTRHRLCLWHITKKAPGKICKLLDDNEGFLRRFNSIVWNDHILPDKFESEWKQMILEFDLEGDNWFELIYSIKEYWAAAYFLDCPMGDLMKTTSISESVNSFFGKYTRHYANLVEFFMHFENAIESQRHSNGRLNSLDLSASYELKTNLPIERHASAIYTNSIFKDVQDQIFVTCYKYEIEHISRDGVMKKYDMRNVNGDVVWVVYNELDKSISCECKMFERTGLLCCHMFVVLKILRINEISDMYLKWRWTKEAYLHPIHANVESVPQESGLIDERKMKVRSMYSKFFEIVSLVESGNLESIEYALSGLSDVAEMVRNVDNNVFVASKKSIFDQFYGKETPKAVSVLPPQHIMAKGSGRRMKSKKEKAVILSKLRKEKSKRKCGRCKQLTDHDARNCKVKLDEPI